MQKDNRNLLHGRIPASSSCGIPAASAVGYACRRKMETSFIAGFPQAGFAAGQKANKDNFGR
jgi:hypothetical protein